MPKNTLVRYLVVGGVAYLIEMGFLYFLKYGAHASSLESVAISFWIGLVAAFVMQKFITFQNYESKTKEVAKQLLGYGILVAWNYGFTLLAVHIFEKSFSVFVIRTAAILIITSWNFIIYKALFKQNN